ncbi:glutamate-1-semialdehyde 2,1-aminomutase [Deltaproteobacteria bacterium]|nr:glutamate-1-semialdehyde 2,1-aminomutase [Deltaproteobacteria bacterium]
MSTHEDTFARARRVLPGGVSSPVRAFKSVGGTPRYARRGEGSVLIGEDGERWTDFCLAWGPLILGHAHPVVIEAVQRAVADGLAFGTVTRAEIELGERILKAYPRHDRVRLMVTGSEAVMTALRLARAHTGRDKVLKFGGCYHGCADSMLVRAGSGLVSFGIGDSAGVPAATAADTLVVPLDDDEALEAAFRDHGSELACAIVEGVPANNGLLIQRTEWLQRLQALCRAHGALFILDEVITGFRFGYHGFDRVAGLEPDLHSLGKIVGGGLPVAAVVGGAAILDRLAPEGSVYQAGTMGGNPVALAAGNATLGVLAEGSTYRHLAALGEHFDGLPKGGVQWVRQGSIVWPWLGSGPPPRTDTALDASLKPIYAGLFNAWLAAGIYMPPSAFEVGFLCGAHTDSDVERLVSVAAKAWAARA